MVEATTVVQLRKNLGLSQAQFARIAGVDVRSLTRWEAGAVRPVGAAGEVIGGLLEAFRRDPERVRTVVANTLAAGGGLRLLVWSLLLRAPPFPPSIQPARAAGAQPPREAQAPAGALTLFDSGASLPPSAGEGRSFSDARGATAPTTEGTSWQD